MPINREQLVEPAGPAELRVVLDEGRRLVGRELPQFLETGTPPSSLHQGGGTYGALGDAMQQEHNRHFVAVYFPTPAELESHLRWHTYCRLHGYPIGELAGAADEPESEYPPHPCSLSKGRWVGLGWARIRTALAGEAPPAAPSIFSDAERKRAREIAARWAAQDG